MESENSEVSERTEINQRLSGYLRDAAKTTVKKYLSHFQFRVFKECYPTLYRHNRKQCKSTHQELIDQLGKSITDDLNCLFRVKKVYQSLNKLDEAINAQRNRTEGWIPSGNPEEDLRDHLYQVKLKHKKRLLLVYQQLKDENEKLLQEVSEKYTVVQGVGKEIEDKNSMINMHFSELEEASKSSTVSQLSLHEDKV